MRTKTVNILSTSSNSGVLRVVNLPSYERRDLESLRLTTLKGRIPQFSTFGDDHHAAIDAQVWVIANSSSESDVYTRASEDQWTDAVTIAALDAVRWLEDLEYPAPAEDWESLAGHNDAAVSLSLAA